MKKNILIIFGILTIVSLCSCTKSTAEMDKYEQTYSSEQTEAFQQTYATDELKQTDEESPDSMEKEETEGNQGATEDKLKESLAVNAEITKEEIRLFEMDDFDNNGEYEAFALVGEEAEYDFDEEGIVAGNVWFVNENESIKLADQEGMGFECKDRILDFGTTKYVIFSDFF